VVGYLAFVETQADKIASRIEKLHIEGPEGEWHLDFIREGDGWERIEQDMDDDGFMLNSFTKKHVSALSPEVADHVAAYLTVTEVQVVGVEPIEFLEWVRPFLDEDQDYITINGRGFDLYEG
jgi:hypothetical protein